MIANCFFWKWADNNLPGKPTDVCGTLLRGELHPAVQLVQFDFVAGRDAEPAKNPCHVERPFITNDFTRD